MLSPQKTNGGVENPENPFYVSAAENSYVGERSYKTGLPLSHKNIKKIMNQLAKWSVVEQ